MPFAYLAGASIIGSLISGAGSVAAGAEQASAAAYAANLQMQMYQQTAANEKPFVTAGQTSENALMAGLGLGPGGGGAGTGTLGAPFNPANLAQTPGYQFSLQQGEQAVQDSASATGGVSGGNTLKALDQYGQGLASTTYQQQLQDYMAWQQQNISALGGITNVGEAAGSNAATGASQFGASIGAATESAGAATAGGISGATNAASSLNSNYLLSSLLGGGAAGGGYPSAASVQALNAGQGIGYGGDGGS
jgi:hypothetical protein